MALKLQGVVMPMSTVLRAATPYTVDVGVAYRITPYTTKKSCSHGGFLRRSQGHRQFSSAVTGYFSTVTPVAALSTAHIGVTTPRAISDCDVKCAMRAPFSVTPIVGLRYHVLPARLVTCCGRGHTVSDSFWIATDCDRSFSSQFCT